YCKGGLSRIGDSLAVAAANVGVSYCKGGLSRIGDSLAVAAANVGVSFVYNAEVQSINVEKDQVACADLPYVYKWMLPDEADAAHFDSLKYTSSAIMFYWGLDTVFPALGMHTMSLAHDYKGSFDDIFSRHHFNPNENVFPALGMHNMFLAHDYKGSFDDIFSRHRLPAEPSFYIHCPVRIDPSAAPPGHDTLMVLVPCGCLSDKMDVTAWEEAAVLERLKIDLGITDPESHLKFEERMSRGNTAVLERLKSDLGITDLESHLKFEERMSPQTPFAERDFLMS
ncbi:hypothetical protein T484DRAFT_1858187, partial [Baffinella frigidus]